MTKFHVAREVEGLFRHNCAINLEDHNSNGSSRDDVSSNELGEDVESQLLVGNREEDAEGEDKDEGKQDGEDISPEWHTRVVNRNGNRSEDERNDENDTEPPVGNVEVARHEAGVNILLILDAGAELPHNITSVPQVGVSDDSGEGGETQAIVHDERYRKEDGRIVAVLLHIEEAVCNDLHNVVRGTGVRVGLESGGREVGTVPGVREVHDRDDEPEPEEERNHGVHLGPPLKRLSETRSRK